MYNPFEKKISEVSLEDLKELKEREIQEGFFIEYKSGFTTPIKIAHSIASFANTYGGWYFVGIDSNEKNIPKDFPGFSLTKQRKPLEHIRNIAKDYIDPFPRYYSKLLELDNKKAILLIEIPESDETPHVTKDGKIYRRNSEGSDPVIESNRYALDRLYERSKNFDEVINRFCRREIVLSEYEKNQGWIEVYMMPYPLNRMEIENFIEKDFVDTLKENMNKQTKIEFVKGTYLTAGIPMNVISASVGSIVLRQANVGALPFMTLTFELFRNGNGKMIIPFEYVDLDAKIDSPAWAMFVSSLEQEDSSLLRVINGWKFLDVFITLLQRYFDFLESQGWDEEILKAFRIENTWRTILFLDSDEMIEHIREYGVPICQRDNAWIPSRLTKAQMIEEMPKDGLFQVVQFALISSHFGFFPHDWQKLTSEWLRVHIPKEAGKPWTKRSD